MSMTKIKTASKYRGGELLREPLPDVIKAIAIFLMVWGHCIQYFHGSGYDFFGDIIYKIIYGFHMPIFAFVSGYLYSRSILKYKPLEIVKKKAVSLLLPCVSWGVILGIMAIASRVVLEGKVISLTLIVENLVAQILGNYWFLKAIFLASIMVLFIQSVLKDNIIVLLAVAFALAIIFSKSEILSILPYFSVGYIFGKKQKNLHIPHLIWLLCLIAYLVIFFVFPKYSWPNHQIVNGSLGTIGFVGLFQVISDPVNKKIGKVIKCVGSNTGAIYIISSMMFTVIAMAMGIVGTTVFSEFPYSIFYDFALIFVSGIIIVASIFIAKILERNKILALLFLGK